MPDIFEQLHKDIDSRFLLLLISHNLQIQVANFGWLRDTSKYQFLGSENSLDEIVIVRTIDLVGDAI